MRARLLGFYLSIPLATRRIALIILLQKIVCTFLLFFSPVLVPSLFPTDNGVERRFTVRDTRSYLRIAARGYPADHRDCAFYPLWPLCIRVSGVLTAGNLVVASYIAANLFSFLGLILFHIFVQERHGLPLANRATLLLTFFPGSIFLFVPYSESLFLLLLAAFWLALQRKHLAGMAGVAFLLPMARPIGIFILPVLAWELFRRKSPPKTYLACAGPILGYTAYFSILYALTGNPFAGFEAQEQYPASPSIGKIIDLPGFVARWADFSWRHDMLHSFMDRGLFVFFLLSLWSIRKMSSGYFVFALGFGLVPALSSSLMSFTRYLSLVFPFFLVLGGLISGGWLFRLLLLACAGGQLLLLLRHISGQWSG